MIFAQEQTPSLIYGTPDEYQGYFVFNKNENIENFKVEVYKSVEIDNATLYHTEELSIHPNQELTINLSSEGMKSGAIFHKFEFEDQSNIIKTTLKE